MFDLLPTEYEWKENTNGNFVCISGGNYHEATVFYKGYEWQIILNGEGFARIVVGESFDNSDDAMERAEAILNGADCNLIVLMPKEASTSWQPQKTISNGSLTYGRKYQGTGVSVKKAKSGKWFYILHGSAPEGWYASAEEAIQAFDDAHT